ncbi:MAG TPA: DNA repair protein RecO, partial [Thermoleophilaceae bacterium]|nr:DNA repair protein RecO [Thermoleophilaceae bacterium]
MAGPFKTEAVVLRSIRYGEADRVLHLYTPDRGRIGAMAKGVRRVRSRLGGRLELLMRVRLVLHEGRGELCTVSQADTVHAHAALRERRGSLERAVQACDAVLRLLDSGESNRPAYNLLCHELALLDADPAAATRAQALAFRAKLLLAAG